MNKVSSRPVPAFVRALSAFALLSLALVLASCSTSRLTEADRVLEPGDHTIRSIIDSDILVPSGSRLHTDYLAGNRIFVQSGGTLSGLGKGGRNSTIFAEEGALVPSLSQKGLVRVVRVDDAEDAFNNRFRNLLPVDARTGTGNRPYVGGAISTGAFYGGSRYYRHRSYYRGNRSYSRPSRSISVKPHSYRSRN